MKVDFFVYLPTKIVMYSIILPPSMKECTSNFFGESNFSNFDQIFVKNQQYLSKKSYMMKIYFIFNLMTLIWWYKY
jgi:hypothetical protein